MDEPPNNLIVKGVFKDTYNLYTKYHGLGLHDDWSQVFQEKSEIYNRYKCPIAKELILSVINQLEREAREVER